MGDRGQVRLKSRSLPDLYFYSHWGATDLPWVVAQGLERGKSRWGDDEYLNRIIFSEIIKNDVLGETGFGIGTILHGDVWKVVEIDHEKQTARVLELEYPEDENEPPFWVEKVSAPFADFASQVAEPVFSH